MLSLPWYTVLKYGILRSDWFLRLKELPVFLQKKAPVMGEEKVSLNIYISIARAMPFLSRSSFFCHIKSAEDTFHKINTFVLSLLWWLSGADLGFYEGVA